ncbi:GNAT family N-acetyltransferase [Cytobacillus massiliigabonensis]|uniref:GNAT family N-acetyltransferase n=1 Tax=Cytobacillus massiliigabonensis TaxID=1871011 RepID=UPI000C836D66|nr:GNAT family N-acetyltransferase [Cytobacillus massiliigabonensis]
MKEILTIDCGDILLREYQLEDVDALYEVTSQPEVYEFIPNSNATREQRLIWMEKYEIPSNKEFLAAIPNIEGQNYLNLGIILKETGQFIGFCNTGIKDELLAPNREIGYAISKDYRNKGYSTMAARGLMKYLFEHTNLEVLNAVALIENISSNKVLQKCGFHYITDVVIDNQKYHHYKLTKNEWLKHKEK